MRAPHRPAAAARSCRRSRSRRGRAARARACGRRVLRTSRSARRSKTADGTVVTGCNIENATYGLTICAERVAMFKAMSEGHRAFTRIAIVADTEAPTPPCGACRQILWEFGGNLEIQLANLSETKGAHAAEGSAAAAVRRAAVVRARWIDRIRSVTIADPDQNSMLPTIAREADAVVMIDQRKLPAEEVYVRCKTAAEVARAIKTMVIRGAPAIGVAAAMGIALGMRRSTATGTQKFAAEFYKICEHDGRHAADGRESVLGDRSDEAVVRRGRARRASRSSRSRIVSIARRALIHDEDVASCRAMGAFGAEVVPADARILTHCNAGALATAGYGTALGVIRGAVEAGKQVVVFADETRPFLQGARLTAWELVRDGIETTVITDNMAGLADAPGRRQFRRRRRRSHRRQRRHREQDRHVQRRRARARARDSVLRRRAAVDDRSAHAGRRRTFRSRSATRGK